VAQRELATKGAMIRHEDASNKHWHGWPRQQPRASGRPCVLGMIFLVAGRLGRLDTRKRIFRRGKLLDNFPQPLGGATSSEPGGNVVALLYLRPKLCQVEHAQATRNTVQVCRNEHDMLASGLIIVTANDDVGTLQRFIEFRPPLAGAHRVAGRSDVMLAQRDDIFLAFDDEDGAARG